MVDRYVTTTNTFEEWCVVVHLRGLAHPPTHCALCRIEGRLRLAAATTERTHEPLSKEEIRDIIIAMPPQDLADILTGGQKIGGPRAMQRLRNLRPRL